MKWCKNYWIGVKISASAGLSSAIPRRINLFWSLLIYFLTEQVVIKENWCHFWNKYKILTYFQLKQFIKKKILKILRKLQLALFDFSAAPGLKREQGFQYKCFNSNRISNKFILVKYFLRKISSRPYQGASPGPRVRYLIIFITLSKYSDEREKHFDQTFFQKSKSNILSIRQTLFLK